MAFTQGAPHGDCTVEFTPLLCMCVVFEYLL